jgi:hypothetical protein
MLNAVLGNSGMNVGKLYWGNGLIGGLLQARLQIKGWPTRVPFLNTAANLISARATGLPTPENYATKLLKSLVLREGNHQLRLCKLPNSEFFCTPHVLIGQHQICSMLF